MRGKDGQWYAYSTGGPFEESGQTSSAYKIATSPDLVHWRSAGDVFPDGHRPTWATATTGFWAPDIRYLNGKYLLYFTVPDTTTSMQGFDPAIGVATAPTPAGPWAPSEEPVIPAKPVGTGYDTVIDPALFTDATGTHYLYYGGFGTGIWVVKLSDDGLRAVTEPTHIAASRYEGPNVLERDGWYYLFGSSANCCAGPTTGYSVFVGRSRSPLGPSSTGWAYPCWPVAPAARRSSPPTATPGSAPVTTRPRSTRAGRPTWPTTRSTGTTPGSTSRPASPCGR